MLFDGRRRLLIGCVTFLGLAATIASVIIGVRHWLSVETPLPPAGVLLSDDLDGYLRFEIGCEESATPAWLLDELARESLDRWIPLRAEFALRSASATRTGLRINGVVGFARGSNYFRALLGADFIGEGRRHRGTFITIKTPDPVGEPPASAMVGGTFILASSWTGAAETIDRLLDRPPPRSPAWIGQRLGDERHEGSLIAFLSRPSDNLRLVREWIAARDQPPDWIQMVEANLDCAEDLVLVAGFDETGFVGKIVLTFPDSTVAVDQTEWLAGWLTELFHRNAVIGSATTWIEWTTGEVAFHLEAVQRPGIDGSSARQ